MSVVFEGDVKSSGKSEIDQFYLALFVYQYVLGLQVAVHDSVRVTICSSFQNLL